MAKRKTLSFTGMDAAEEDALKQAFAKANRQLGNTWEIAPESEAEVLVVDVDTIYGHMTWLRMHNSGRPIVALSSSSKAEADHVLTRPVNADKLAELLAQFDGGKAAAAEPASREPAPQPPDQQQPAQRAAAAPAPAPTATSAAAAPAPAAAQPAAAAPAAPAPEPLPEPEPEPEPPPPPRDPMLADYFEAGALPGPVKLSIPGAPVLALDPQKRQYVAPAALKPLIPYCKRVIHPEDWTAITPAELEKLKAEHGAHPFSRLLWLFALSNGEGQLAAGYDINEKFRLTKWPQIEREYPKHFRIATVMMKQPATLPEIAEQSGAPLPEVVDFVNAYLATGFAEMEQPPAPVDPNAQARAGFLGRLRGQRSG